MITILGNIIKYLRILLLVIIIAFKASLLALVIYSEKKEDCVCGKEWYRLVIKVGCVFVIILSLVAYFTPIVKILRMIPIIGGFIVIAVVFALIVLFYAIKKYMDAISDDDCKCKYKKQLKLFNNLLSMANLVTLGIIILILIVAIFYLF